MKYEVRYFLDFVFWIIIVGIGVTMSLVYKEREDICFILFVPLLFFITLMAINWSKAKKEKKKD